MDIPPHLEEQVKNGRVALLLGAGASLDATDVNGNRSPRTDELRDMLCDKFLGGKLKNRTLSQVAEYAISEASLVVVQDYIRQLVEPLRPTEAHKLLPSFRWWGIATTNYERLIEVAYGEANDPTQQLVTLIENGDLVDQYTRNPTNVLLLKLHGCITRIANASCPLILTIDQYIDHRAGRSRLFEQLTDWGYEHSFVFIGHSLQDSDIRQIIKDLTKGAAARSRFYCVVPDADPIEQRTLEQRRITILTGSFNDFMTALDSRIPAPFRRIVIAPSASSLSIAGKFRNPAAVPSSNLVQFLTTDAEYVKAISATTTMDARDFYKGFNPGFSAVEQQLDIRREIGDEILTDLFLASEAEHAPTAELVLIKAHAGAGKTVLLRRLAWDAAHDYDCICLFIRADGLINVYALQELLELCQQRVYFFVDDAADRVRDLEALMERIGPLGQRLTVVVAERLNEWNVACQSLNARVTDVYELKYLTSHEIDGLIALLEKNKAEGELQGHSAAEKKAAFEEVAGRQLLVALHEATLGTPFRDIIQNEFDNIWPLEAKQIYLTICSLNRLNVAVRAGIIARIHGVPFEEFKARLFQPLEHIVQAEADVGSRDYVYRARHPYIAQMVFDRVLQKQEERFEQYMRCLGALNIDYSSDRIAFRQMTRAKTVLELFSNHELAVAIYERAHERAGSNDGSLIHQMALYELNRPNGNLQLTSELLVRAVDLRPYDQSIKHSFAELHLRLADEARTELERVKHLDEAKTLCDALTGKAATDAYGYVTLAKVGLRKLKDALDGANALAIEQTVKEVESALGDGFQRFPNDGYLRKIESRLAEAINDSDRAISALQKALQTNPRSTFIAIRLAQSYRKRHDDANALTVLETALGANNNERRLHYAYARLLMVSNAPNEKLLYHLQRAFVPGDTNYDAQLLYGRQLYLAGKTDEAWKVFKVLKATPTSPEVKFEVLYPVDGTFTGEITRMEATYCFIARDGIGDRIYAHRDNIGTAWADLGVRRRVVFRFGFAFGGPSAFDVKPEQGSIDARA